MYLCEIPLARITPFVDHVHSSIPMSGLLQGFRLLLAIASAGVSGLERKAPGRPAPERH